jgi:outer membrane murein-binding lipoprotein Lpp
LPDGDELKLFVDGKEVAPNRAGGNSRFVKHVSMVALVLVFVVAGCDDNRVPALEMRVKQLEEKIHQLEADRSKSSEDDSARRTKLESCVADANAGFQKNLESNGTKQRNGSYNVSVPLLEQMQRQKQAKIEECRLLYAK